MLAGADRLDGGVQGEHVGLRRDRLGLRHELLDLPRRLSECRRLLRTPLHFFDQLGELRRALIEHFPVAPGEVRHGGVAPH